MSKGIKPAERDDLPDKQQVPEAQVETRMSRLLTKMREFNVGYSDDEVESDLDEASREK